MIKKYLTFESEHYIFHYFKGSFAEEDIEEISIIQEDAFQKIINFFKVEVPFKIYYYLFNTAKEVGIASGDFDDSNGYAEEPNIIYAVYNETVKCIGPHEDAHIISYLINQPNSGFIREGIAMYFDEYWWKKLNTDWVKEFIEKGTYHSIESLLDDEHFYSLDCSISYPIAGAFAKYLIDTYGQKKYIKFYRLKGEVKESFKSIYNKTVEELEEEFLILIMSSK